MNQDINQPDWFVIINPNAGNGKGRKDWHKISLFLSGEGIHFTERFTNQKGHAMDLTREAIASGFRKIITVGGDGTLNEVVNGVFNNPFCGSSDVALALIPVGTGNDWGRMFGIPSDYQKSARIIHDFKVMNHDAGIVRFHNGDTEHSRYFINIAGLGFESEVVRRTNYQKDKGRGGKLIYLYNLLCSLFSYKNTPVHITIDGDEKEAVVFSINVGNGRFCGGGMRQTPGAVPDDGMLDVTVIRNIGKIEIIRKLKILYDGTILSHPMIDGYKCRNIKVSSDSILYTEADGESLGHTPAEFSIVPAGLTIVYGTRLI
jgi:diacylglycerol kinase (ATP)